VTELERGAVCLALYPFRTSFPLERVVREAGAQLEAQLESFESIDDLEVTIRPGEAPEVVTAFKLRRVVLLQDATDGRLRDLAVLPVSSVTDRHRSREGWYRRLQDGTNLTALRVGSEDRHGTAGKEAYVNLLSVSTIPRETILRRSGRLSEAEMQEISERLVVTLELDVSGLLERLHAKTPRSG